MADPKQNLSLDEFRARAAQLGLTLSEEDLGHLHKGYIGLLQLMERIPTDWAAEAEPGHIFQPLLEARQ
jgi:hypothetical protein